MGNKGVLTIAVVIAIFSRNGLLVCFVNESMLFRTSKSVGEEWSFY